MVHSCNKKFEDAVSYILTCVEKQFNDVKSESGDVTITLSIA